MILELWKKVLEHRFSHFEKEDIIANIHKVLDWICSFLAIVEPELSGGCLIIYGSGHVVQLGAVVL